VQHQTFLLLPSCSVLIRLVVLLSLVVAVVVNLPSVRHVANLFLSDIASFE
jgi:hypothetical protein